MSIRDLFRRIGAVLALAGALLMIRAGLSEPEHGWSYPDLDLLVGTDHDTGALAPVPLVN